MSEGAGTRYRRVAALAWVAIALTVAAGCGGSKPASHPGPSAPTAAQLAEARRLLDPDNLQKDPAPADVACVARVVVQDPNVDAIANDMAQIADKDLRELVMTDYLHCAYDYVVDLYMRFAPAGISPAQLKCIRSKFTELTVKRLSEVIVEDPDAGYTGPLVIASCKSGAKTNPLANGTFPGMGGS